MTIGDEVTLQIGQGKALVVLFTALGETRDDGQVEVFFELNGRPRIITVLNQSTMSTVAEDGSGNHIAAPMPGVVSTISVIKDQVVKTGDVL